MAYNPEDHNLNLKTFILVAIHPYGSAEEEQFRYRSGCSSNHFTNCAFSEGNWGIFVAKIKPLHLSGKLAR
jgi:hypothetical protein